MPEVTRVRESRYMSRDPDDYSSDDDRSSSYGRSRPAGYRTVQRYRVTPSRTDLDDDIRSIHSERYSGPSRAERVEVDRRVERHVDREPERSSRDIIIEREREREPERTRTVVYERERERERERPRESLSGRPWERERDRPWERETDVRVERRIDRREEQPMQLERYQKETEYYDRPEPTPQPIIIRQRAPEPQQIIVQEAPQPQPIVLAREEPSYEVIHRSEVQELARPEPRRDDEEYYYHREVRETDGRGRDDDYAMARYDRRPPSVSDYSDDEQVIVRRDRKSFRSRSPKHKRHLAEGALAGAGAAALLANHREKQGIEVEHKGRNVVGGAVLGAIGTEIATRARSRYRERESRSRGRRSRSSSRDSHSKLKIGLGLAALGVAAAVANKVNQNRIANRDELGRGRSRTRSVSRRRSVSAFSRTRSASRHHDPKHRASAMAKAGAATAAVAGVVEYARNKSRERKGKPSRSRSRLRTGVPIAATGLAGAAVAGLYEMRKAKQEDEEALAETRHHLRRTSRSRSRPRSAGYAETIDPELGMVQYGADPVYTKQTTTTESYDPVMSGGGSHRSQSRSRRRDYSSDSDRVVSRSRSRSRARDLASGAIATGAAAIGINKLKKHQERKREEREDRRHYRGDVSPEYFEDEPYSESVSDSPPRASGGAYFPQNTGGYTQHTTSTTHVNEIPQYDPRDYTNQEPYPADPYGRTAAQRGRDGDNVSIFATESPEEDNLMIQNHSMTSLERPHNRSVTFAPLSPTSSRRLAKIKTNGQSSSSLPESEPSRHRRRRNSDPSYNRPSRHHHHHRHHHQRHSSSPSSSEEDIEVLPDRFDKYGQPIEHTGKEEMVERILSDVEAVVDGRVSWRDMLRPLFQKR